MKKPNNLSLKLRPARAGDRLDVHERALLVNRARQIRSGIEQSFADADRWNQLYPDEAIDVDPDGSLRQIADELDAFLLSEQPRPM